MGKITRRLLPCTVTNQLDLGKGELYFVSEFRDRVQNDLPIVREWDPHLFSHSH